MTVRDYSAIDPAIHATREEDIAFERRFGPWAAPTPVEAVAVLAAFARPWWVCGGYAVEAFTGVVRPHDDLDIGFFRRDLAVLREALGDRYDLWSVGSGMLRPLTGTVSGSTSARPRSRHPWRRSPGSRTTASATSLRTSSSRSRPSSSGRRTTVTWTRPCLCSTPRRGTGCGRSWSASTPTTSG